MSDENKEKNIFEREFDRHSEVWKAGVQAWQATLDELKVQFNLGKKEAIDEFEEQKKNFGEWVEALKSKVENEGDLGKEFVDEIKGDIDDLKVQLTLGKAETKDLYEEQKEKILAAIEKLRENLTKAYGKLDDEMNGQLEKFRAQLESLRVQFELGKYETKDELEEKKTELNQLVGDFQDKMKDAEEKGKEKVDSFTEEMTKSFDHLKNAFAELLK